jgi:hypothetical protein
MTELILGIGAALVAIIAGLLGWTHKLKADAAKARAQAAEDALGSSDRQLATETRSIKERSTAAQAAAKKRATRDGETIDWKSLHKRRSKLD